jgi:hypothetical protein
MINSWVKLESVQHEDKLAINALLNWVVARADIAEVRRRSSCPMVAARCLAIPPANWHLNLLMNNDWSWQVFLSLKHQTNHIAVITGWHAETSRYAG